MKTKIFILFILFLCMFARNTSAIKLTKDATISILTCAPGNELYSLFGHTGIRVTDKANNLDIVFNYGTFDFNTQGFYFKFARGLLPYQLSCSDFDRFMASYVYEERSVYSQILNLDSIQKQRLMDLLVENYQPQNRTYLYNFLYDNCTTRARDIVEKSTDNSITWIAEPSTKSFWNMLDEYLCRSQWTQWGIHTILGSPATSIVTTREQMFLPDYLMYRLDSAYFNGKPLVEPIKVIYQAPDQTPNNPWYISPFFVFAVCTLALILLLQKYRSRRLLKAIAIPFFIITGIIGCLIVFLCFFTKHPTMYPNFNALWANPLNLIAAFFIGKEKLPWIINKYIFVYLYILIIGFLLWFLFIPAVPYASMVIFVWMIYLCIRLRQVQK
ncbi:DUF4105 domain-containing protein [uncultured Butyricimonas sp.]|uniref:Lnb N-terminal periplasmic domain-containing protein n=1 Tax=uncultured Butyricimonas sp. TaxID=1268785 RepID=UPI0026DBB664|nr:DUF4105 domain-containing protein [uncultured Butyricimonas sp.]